MENIENYGDLSNSELLEFLEEIKSGDEDIEEAEANANDKINDEEAQSMLSELPENAEIEAYYGDNAWIKPPIYSGYRDRVTILRDRYDRQKISSACIAAIKKKANALKENKLKIQRDAFNQNNINLSDKIEKYNIQLLISTLTKEHTRMVDKYSDYINKRLTTLLNPFIPRRLRVCKMLYPDSMRINPGFLYRASKEYGDGLTFWATPSIPYYFEQNTEQSILLKNKPEFLFSIDKAVCLYYTHLNARQEKEIKYASSIIKKNITTYFDLLKFNPFWFDTLYKELIK